MSKDDLRTSNQRMEMYCKFSGGEGSMHGEIPANQSLGLGIRG